MKGVGAPEPQQFRHRDVTAQPFVGPVGTGADRHEVSVAALDIGQTKKGRWFVAESLHIDRNGRPRRPFSNFVEMMYMSASRSGSGQQYPIGSKAAISICRLVSIVSPR